MYQGKYNLFLEKIDEWGIMNYELRVTNYELGPWWLRLIGHGRCK